MSTATESKPTKEEEMRLPSVDLAQARIAQALIKYKVRIARGGLTTEEKKIRL
jgi:hypothetical protein